MLNVPPMLSLPVETIESAGATPSKLNADVRSVPWPDPLTVTVLANALGFDEMIRSAMTPAPIASFEQMFLMLIAFLLQSILYPKLLSRPEVARCPARAAAL